MQYLRSFFLLVVLSSLFIPTHATAQRGYSVTKGEYKLPPRIDPYIMSNRVTELWASTHHPGDRYEDPLPVVIFLHGNHATCGTGPSPRLDDNCQYTTQGTCPAGYEVVHNHAGYDYIINDLVPSGFFAISINANRGINCGGGLPGDAGLNKVRGRLILRHLELLKEWNSGDRPTPEGIGLSLEGRLDLSRVGLVGHSRGGEGIRAAYTFLRDNRDSIADRLGDEVKITTLFEIGGADGQTNEIFDADGAVWTQLIPMCDGDLFQLPGVRPYDRMQKSYDESPPTQKGILTVWGTNHNYYNTEWERGDSGGCEGHSPIFEPVITLPDVPGPGPTPTPPPPPASGSRKQQEVGRELVAGYFKAYLGDDNLRSYRETFNPNFPVPNYLRELTRIERSYTPSPNFRVTPVIEDFSQQTGVNVYGSFNLAQGISIQHTHILPHDMGQRVASIGWGSSGGSLRITPLGNQMVDVSGYSYLDIRLSRRLDTLNSGITETGFSIGIISGDSWKFSKVNSLRYVSLQGPVGGPLITNHPVLHTLRIPLEDFPNAFLENFRGVKFLFDQTPRGAIHIGEIRLALGEDNGSEPLDGPGAGNPGAALGASGSQARLVSKRYTGQITDIKRDDSQSVAVGDQDIIITLSSDIDFHVGGALLILKIGDREYDLSKFPDDGSLKEVTFKVPGADAAFLQDSDAVKLQIGKNVGSPTVWDFGALGIDGDQL